MKEDTLTNDWDPVSPTGRLSDVVRVVRFGKGKRPGQRASRAIARALADPKVLSIVVEVTAPGGSLDGAAELSAAIGLARTRKEVAVLWPDPGPNMAACYVTVGRKAGI